MGVLFGMTSDTAVLVWTEEIPENTSGIVSHELIGDCHYTVSTVQYTNNLPLAYHSKIPLAKNHALLYRMHLLIIDSHHPIIVSYF